MPAAVLPGMYEYISKLTKRYGDRMFADDDAQQALRQERRLRGRNHHALPHATRELSGFNCRGRFPVRPAKRQQSLITTATCAPASLREKFATLSDFDYDFGALWAAHERDVELKAIDGGKACWCTHVCFIHDSMRHSSRAMLYELPEELPHARELAIVNGNFRR